MKNFKLLTTVSLLFLFSACGSDDETAEQAPRGILTNQQNSALDAANNLEQTIQDLAEERKRELEARLRDL